MPRLYHNVKSISNFNIGLAHHHENNSYGHYY